MKLAIDIGNQDEYILTRNYITEHGGKVGFDSSCGKGFIYVIDGKEDKITQVRVGCTKDIPEIKRQKYKYVLASEMFKEELSIPHMGYCCDKFKYVMTVADDLVWKKNKRYYIDEYNMTEKSRIYYCPFCGKKL